TAVKKGLKCVACFLAGSRRRATDGAETRDGDVSMSATDGAGTDVSMNPTDDGPPGRFNEGSELSAVRASALENESLWISSIPIWYDRPRPPEQMQPETSEQRWEILSVFPERRMPAHHEPA
ncbi:hypothetical protein LEMLEM_LOCUS8641, partial [Lemmus lemmus]